jgi:NRPS condensation-like uncharacterized protein
MIRKLGIFERALVISDRHAPFNVVSVLQLENSPASEIVEHAVMILSNRHPLMQANISADKFEYHTSRTFSLRIIEQEGDFNWLDSVEEEMNTRLDASNGLFRGVYLFNKKNATLILTFHHAIMDATSGMNLLDELLQICASTLQSTEVPPLPNLEVASAVEKKFPPSFKGLFGLVRLLQYALSQIGDELRYQWRIRGKRFPPVKLGGQGFPLTLTLSESLIDELSKRCRAERVTLNSLLNASLLLATNRWLYNRSMTPMRTFSFADLRLYTVPPTPAEHLANYISMLRFTEDISSKSTIWEVTKSLHMKIYRALKRGDKFSAVLMSESLLKMFTTMKSMRMGSTALNYSGAVPLEVQYGKIKITGLHAFLSSYDLGPEVSAQARLFKDELWIDFMFLDTDMNRKTAEKIVEEVKTILEGAVSA